MSSPNSESSLPVTPTATLHNNSVVPKSSFHNTAIVVGSIFAVMLVALAAGLFVCRARGTNRRHSTVELAPDPYVLPTHVTRPKILETRTKRPSPLLLSPNPSQASTAADPGSPSTMLPRDMIKQLCHSPQASEVSLSSLQSKALGMKSPLSPLGLPPLSNSPGPSPVTPSFSPNLWEGRQEGPKAKVIVKDADEDDDEKTYGRASDCFSFDFKCPGEDFIFVIRNPDELDHDGQRSSIDSDDSSSCSKDEDEKCSLKTPEDDSLPDIRRGWIPATPDYTKDHRFSTVQIREVRSGSPILRTSPHHRNRAPGRSCLKGTAAHTVESRAATFSTLATTTNNTTVTRVKSIRFSACVKTSTGESNYPFGNTDADPASIPLPPDSLASLLNLAAMDLIADFKLQASRSRRSSGKFSTPHSPHSYYGHSRSKSLPDPAYSDAQFSAAKEKAKARGMTKSHKIGELKVGWTMPRSLSTPDVRGGPVGVGLGFKDVLIA